MSYEIRLTTGAQKDLVRLFSFLADKDIAAAKRARIAIEKSYELLAELPFSCRKVSAENPFLREVVISFGSAGYVGLFEIENDSLVTILAFRHQREDDYY